MIRLNLFEDQFGNNTFAAPFSDAVYNAVIPTDTLTTVAVPSWARVAIFGYAGSGDYYIATETFANPSSSTFVENPAMLNPPPMILRGDGFSYDTLYIRCPSAARLSVAFYQ